MMMTDHAPKNQQDEFDWGEREIDEVEVVSEEQLEERFSESMAELYGEVEIMGQTFDAVYAYKELDPIGYTQAFVNWLDSEGYDELRPSILKALEEED